MSAPFKPMLTWLLFDGVYYSRITGDCTFRINEEHVGIYGAGRAMSLQRCDWQKPGGWEWLGVAWYERDGQGGSWHPHKVHATRTEAIVAMQQLADFLVFGNPPPEDK